MTNQNTEIESPADETAPVIYVLVENGTVTQKESVFPAQEDYINSLLERGFIPAPDDTVCGHLYSGRDFMPPPSPTTLGDIKSEAQKNIDFMAEQTRLKFITGGAGQAMVYQRKTQEAEAMALDESPAAVNYPLLAAELGITGETLAEIGETVLARRDLWLGVAAQIEQTRLLAKAAVNAATDADQVALVLDGLTWPAPGV